MRKGWFTLAGYIFNTVLFVATAANAAEKVKYVGNIEKIMRSHCVGCHGSDSPEYGAFKAEKKEMGIHDERTEDGYL